MQKNDQNSTSNDNNNELLVVGYSINKVYQNLDKENFKDGKSEDHLIPLNNDTNLLVDKFDCRIYLSDLNEHDSELRRNERESDIVDECNESNQEDIERLCDQERYKVEQEPSQKKN